jgi:hypothetical protein
MAWYRDSFTFFLCVYSVCVVLCVGSAALRRADPASKESYRLCKNDYETEEEARAQEGL